MCVLREGAEISTRGWSEPEWIEFPPPLGRRLEYLAIDTAERDLFAREFGARRVEFKAGSEFPWLNRALALAARLRFPALDRCASSTRIFLKLLGHFGTDAGGVLVEIEGRGEEQFVRQQIAVVALNHGERIPALLAAIAVRALLGGELTARGWMPLATCLATTTLFKEFHRRGLQFWLKTEANSEWRRLHNAIDLCA
jgi:hypothetical protein